MEWHDHCVMPHHVGKSPPRNFHSLAGLGGRPVNGMKSPWRRLRSFPGMVLCALMLCVPAASTGASSTGASTAAAHKVKPAQALYSRYHGFIGSDAATRSLIQGLRYAELVKLGVESR